MIVYVMVTVLLVFTLFITPTLAAIHLKSNFTLGVSETTLSSGYFHTCIIEARPGVEYGGPIKCWGRNEGGKATPPPGMFVQISSGHIGTCAVSVHESVSCWGNEKLFKVPKGDFRHVCTGEAFACGVRKNETLACWGHRYTDATFHPNGHFVQVKKK
jgi:hypothetical protein